MPDHPMSRREMLTTMGGLALTSMMGARPAPAGEDRPHLLFIMTDDHAAHALSCYGSRINTTPHLDRIARQGMRFNHCFVTNSLCAPSRATLLTGRYSHAHGVIDNRVAFDGSQTTFPQLLQQAGYQTAVVGKWHLKSDPTGFDYWNILPGQGRYHHPILIEMGERREHPGYVTDVITDAAIAYMERARGRPFCLLCHHKAPHRGWQPDDRHAQMYADRDLPRPETYDDDYGRRAGAAAHADMRIADMPDYRQEHREGMSPAEIKDYNYQRFIKDYLRTIASVDDNVGRVLDYLDEAGLAPDTVVIYTSDNGFFLGDHGWFDKRFMYEESLRVPLLVRYPREIAPARVDDHLVLNVDVAPTLLDYAGLPTPETMHGRSLRPLLRGEAPGWRPSIYYRYYEYPQPHRARPHYGVRTLRHKLIYYHTIDEWEFFDLLPDPYELRNAYDDPAYRQVIAELKAELERLRQEVQDLD